MDNVLTQIGVSSSSVVILFTLYKVILMMKGHLIVSKCCKKRFSVGYDIEDNMDSPLIEQIN